MNLRHCPLQADIAEALRSRPMTIRECAAAVSSTYDSTREAIAALEHAHIVRRHGWRRQHQLVQVIELVEAHP